MRGVRGVCACSFFNQSSWEGKKTKPHIQVQTLLQYEFWVLIWSGQDQRYEF